VMVMATFYRTVARFARMQACVNAAPSGTG
jgi:hypothetical protein